VLFGRHRSKLIYASSAIVAIDLGSWKLAWNWLSTEPIIKPPSIKTEGQTGHAARLAALARS